MCNYLHNLYIKNIIMNITKEFSYYVNGELVTVEKEIALSEEELIDSRVIALKYKLSEWTITVEEKEELQLLVS